METTQNNTHKPGDLQVWWIPQVPMTAFQVDVPDLVTARLLLDTLARYDAFQFENNIKPDYSNAGGLVIWEDNYDGEGTSGFVDWYSQDGTDFDDIPTADLAVFDKAAGR